MNGREYDPVLVQFAARLFELARLGKVAELRGYLDEGVPVGLTNDKGETLLMLAACHGHAELVTALLEHGADPNQADDLGRTPLSGALSHGKDEVVRALLAGGADPPA